MRLIEKVWFNSHLARYLLVPLLLPLTMVFYLLSALRRLAFKVKLFKSYKISKPVIVVGNIGVGGNGKTPVVIHLIELAKTLNLKVGVISRGYGGNAPSYPYLLDEHSTSAQAGDEPMLIFQRCHVPVVVGADRVASSKLLVEQGCDLIISDDGLQHYRLQRDLEIIVIDGKRLFGNGLLLPAGPLREGQWRLKQAELLIYNGKRHNGKKHNDQKPNGKTTNSSSSSPDDSLLMTLAAIELVHVKTAVKMPLSCFLKQNKIINAAAGIGDPMRFFTTLTTLGFALKNQQGFVDHKDYMLDDFNQFKNDIPLLMTEKDAVKCQEFAQNNWWYLPVSAHFSEHDQQILQHKIQALASAKAN